MSAFVFWQLKSSQSPNGHLKTNHQFDRSSIVSRRRRPHMEVIASFACVPATERPCAPAKGATMWASTNFSIIIKWR